MYHLELCQVQIVERKASATKNVRFAQVENEWGTTIYVLWVDLLRSFLVKDGRKEVKRYGTLHTCLSSRPIHIEVVYSLSNNSFDMSLRRFAGSRGDVRLIRCDNGSNLVVASRELTRAFQKKNHIKIGNGEMERMVVGGWYGKETHHSQATWEEFRNARFGKEEQFRTLYWRCNKVVYLMSPCKSCSLKLGQL